MDSNDDSASPKPEECRRATLLILVIEQFIIRLFVKICKTPPADTDGGVLHIYKKFKKYLYNVCLFRKRQVIKWLVV